jgi:hypothetical protein
VFQNHKTLSNSSGLAQNLLKIVSLDRAHRALSKCVFAIFQKWFCLKCRRGYERSEKPILHQNGPNFFKPSPTCRAQWAGSPDTFGSNQNPFLGKLEAREGGTRRCGHGSPNLRGQNWLKLISIDSSQRALSTHMSFNSCRETFVFFSFFESPQTPH